MRIGRFIRRHSQHFLHASIFPISYLWRILRQLSYLCPSTPSILLFIFFFGLTCTYTVLVLPTLIRFLCIGLLHILVIILFGTVARPLVRTV
jgi:hypothetical protein